MNSVSVTAHTEWPVGPAIVPALLVTVPAVAALPAIAYSSLSPLLRIVLSLVLCVYAGWHVFRLLVPRWKALRIGGNEAELIDRHNEAHSIRIDERSFVSPLFAGFDCCSVTAGQCTSVGLFRVQLGQEAFRLLSVTLRHGSQT